MRSRFPRLAAPAGAWLALATASISAAQTPAADPPPAVQLAEAKQKQIWDAEHVTFKLETYFAKPLVDALLARDATRLRGAFQEGFAGELLAAGEGRLRQAGPVTVRRRGAAELGRRETDAAGLVDYLLGSTAGFERIDGGRLRVLHIDSIDRDPSRWTTELLLSIRGVGSSGPREVESWHEVDFRLADDGELDGRRVVTRWSVASEVLRSSTQVLMEEITERVGLDSVPLPDNWKLPASETRQYRFQLAVEDFDRDGFLDIAVGSLDGRPILLRSIEGRHYEDVGIVRGLRPAASIQKSAARNSLVTWIDHDNDGWPDLIIGGRFYRNVEGQRFVDLTGPSGLRISGVPLGATVFDYDADGRLDLYVLYQTSSGVRDRAPHRPWVGDSDSGAENELWRNEGGGRFRNVTEESGAGGGRHHTFAAAPLFHDGDRFPDLYVANDFGTNVLLRNRGDGTFEDVSGSAGVADYSTSMGVIAGDLNNDGHPEIYVANMYSKMGRRIIAHVGPADYPPGVYEQVVGSCAGHRLYSRPAGDAPYTDLGAGLEIEGVGWAYAPSMVDLDGDGWLDLYASTGFMSFERGKPDG